MTLTLEIAPEIQRALEEAARANWQTLPAFAVAQLAEVARKAAPTTATPKITAASVRGKYAMPGADTVDEFMAERRAEGLAEMRAEEAAQAARAQRRAA